MASSFVKHDNLALPGAFAPGQALPGQIETMVVGYLEYTKVPWTTITKASVTGKTDTDSGAHRTFIQVFGEVTITTDDRGAGVVNWDGVSKRISRRVPS